MNTKGVPLAKSVLATPLNVEESRAQRQQRSQARFRDRGGIFVPTSRNTLADILLGKAPPLKKRRSVSASPLGHLQQGIPRTQLHRISSPTKQKTPVRKPSKSPQKQSRKSVQGTGEKDSVVDTEPTKTVPNTAKSKAKGVSKPSAQTAKPKAARKSKKATSEDEAEADESPAKPRPRPKKKFDKSKPFPEPAEASERVPDVDQAKPLKAKSTAATTKQKPSKSTTSKPSAVANTTAKSKPKPSHAPAQPISQPSVPASSTQPTSSTTISKSVAKKPARSRSRKSDLYSGASEDEYIPKVSKTKQKPKKTPSVPVKPAAKAPPRPLPQAGPSKLADIMEEDEEEEEMPPKRNEPSQPPPSAKLSVISSTHTKKEVNGVKTKKRSAQDDEDDDERPPPAKRAKAAVDKEEITKSAAKAKPKPKDPGPEKTKNSKRNREREDDSLPDEIEKKPAKRKKAMPELEKETTTEPNTKAKKKDSKTTTKSGSKAKKPPGKVKTVQAASAENGRQKENVSVPEKTLIAPKRGPPKSVLQRLKARDSQPDVIDNDPDPIDFLS